MSDCHLCMYIKVKANSHPIFLKHCFLLELHIFSNGFSEPDLIMGISKSGGKVIRGHSVHITPPNFGHEFRAYFFILYHGRSNAMKVFFLCF